jgi:hypothetical protein
MKKEKLKTRIAKLESEVIMLKKAIKKIKSKKKREPKLTSGPFGLARVG